MPTDHPLASQLEILLGLRSQLEVAAGVHKDYVQHRSWWALVRDAVFVQASQKRLRAAEQAYAAAEAGVRSDLTQWIGAATVQALHADTSANTKQQDLLARRAEAEARHGRLGNFLSEANKVCRLLETAISDCEAASTSEVFDMLSSSKAIALMSSMHTGDAKDSVQAAQAGLRKFVESWPKRGAGLDAPELDDTLDFVLDMAGVSVDVLSFFNIQALDDAADACKSALKQVKQQVQPVAAASDKLKGRIQQLNVELLHLRQPFFQRVLAELPPPLKAYAPSSLSL